MASHVFPNQVFSQTSYTQTPQPIPKIISFNPDSSQYQSIFEGEKDSVVFYSGIVTLAPNKSGEFHNTEIYQEMIIPLVGIGQLQIENHKSYDVRFGNIVLVPSHTEHRMTNTDIKNFKYIYIAVKTKTK
jgi:mannose-6-phosphate isomerase-like protein (cupin superfamily)